jgi:ribosomal protein L40E
MNPVQIQVTQYQPPVTAITFPTESISFPTSELPQPSPAPDYSTPLALLAVAACVIGVLGFIIHRGNAAARATKSKTLIPTVPEQEARTEETCVNCGNKLPTDSKFCNKCGTQQP